MRCTRMLFAMAMLGGATAIAGCASQSSSSRSHELDGTAYDVALRPDGQEPMRDRLIFDRGEFESTVCTGAGFRKSAYTESSAEGAKAFAVQCDSPSMGHNDWHGTLVGEHIEGTLVRTPKDGGTPIHCTFAGDRVH